MPKKKNVVKEKKNDGKPYENYTRNILNDETVRKYLEDKFNLEDVCKISSRIEIPPSPP
ncbi:hypothetical protein Cylst_2249 [Cylindrospermum stagnale PCC 7417]|uniref:Uncharacterized protein n=1 Tax=Cylindrospermum stagnale PCC 7417 TaxID=56107 RepID=K9WVS2_9NOST|nr:hypothetical protein [Cylindrospermum stagnale]AFZ24480.1 hypothetical protein Cylst_2249 [Cylindrospermum stagnale PCC 7417]